MTGLGFLVRVRNASAREDGEAAYLGEFQGKACTVDRWIDHAAGTLPVCPTRRAALAARSNAARGIEGDLVQAIGIVADVTVEAVPDLGRGRQA